MKNILFIILLFMSSSSFAQIKQSTTVEIESGQTTKNYIGATLESMVVELFAVNYGNALTFTKVNDQIVITNAQEPNAVIKITLNNKYLVRTLFYNEKMVSSTEAIAFDLENLPKSSTISNQIVKGKVESYVGKTELDATMNYDFDKTYKLFARLTISTDLNNIDAVFESIAAFFSQEDALLKVFLGSYARKNQPIMSGYLKTNALGKIESGIIWLAIDNENGKYEIYSKGKITKTEKQTLIDFQETIVDYFEKTMID
ncbi:hypothetical protein [Flavobacterium tegetincola]|uniref:hypothetical protein n=1 Tax=Flavobacterium tegetincola TaxID=150172 RepID=UPI0004288E8E|nr:hypothetical protein [Flavobacterium tegetincola]